MLKLGFKQIRTSGKGNQNFEKAKWNGDRRKT